MWVWFKLKSDPKVDHTKTDVTTQISISNACMGK